MPGLFTHRRKRWTGFSRANRQSVDDILASWKTQSDDVLKPSEAALKTIYDFH
jgi:hypothetical protein